MDHSQLILVYELRAIREALLVIARKGLGPEALELLAADALNAAAKADTLWKEEALEELRVLAATDDD